MNKETTPRDLTPVQRRAQDLENDKFIAAIERALPRNGVAPERFIRFVHTELMNPTSNLASCTTASFLGACIKSAQLGLVPGMLGQAWLVPFYNSKIQKQEVQFIIGYQGLIELSRRAGEMVHAEARPVYRADTFDYSFGSKPHLTHIPCEDESQRDELMFVYAMMQHRNGMRPFEVMTKTALEAHKRKYAPRGGEVGPWKNHTLAMMQKTVLIRLFKYAAKTPEIGEAVYMSEREGVSSQGLQGEWLRAGGVDDAATDDLNDSLENLDS